MITDYERKVQPRFSEISTWIIEGKTFEEIAALLGVSDRNLLRYRKKYPEFQEALDAGREELVQEIERTFMKRLLGKTVVKRIKTHYIYDESGNKRIDWQDVSEEPIQASTADYVFFLTQFPDRWKNRQNDLSTNDVEETLKNSIELLNTVKEKAKEE